MVCRAMASDSDPVRKVADLLDRLDQHIARAGVVASRDERNRLSLLHVHAVIGTLVAPLFNPNVDSPIWIVLRHIPHVPNSLAALIGCGGLILLPAVLVRALWWEMVGLTMMIVWYTVMSVGFASAIGVWLAHGRQAATEPALYAPLIYIHLAIIMAVHLRTIYRMRQATR